MNKVTISGYLDRDPEVRTLASGRTMTSFVVVAAGSGDDKEYISVVAWDHLAEVCGSYLGRDAVVIVEGSLLTRQWDGENGMRHWKTEVVASEVQKLHVEEDEE